ncbi:MAG: YchF-related putative GTPase [Candidatus Micrarchaeota archaeon]
MLIGIVGAPNKGKSRFFASVCRVEVQVADYPFTTIDPNRAVAYLRVKCPSVELGIVSTPRNGRLEDGMRDVPVQLVDVAGLVPGAHEGRGMGNKFLDDLSSADGFLQIIDASGRTDLGGQAARDFDLELEAKFLEEEMRFWILGILKKNAAKFRGRDADALSAALSGLSYSAQIVQRCAANAGMNLKRIGGGKEELERLSHELAKNAKPKIIVANKCDVAGARERALALAGKEYDIVCASAEYEYALQRAKRAGLVEYSDGAREFRVAEKADAKQRAALEKIAKFMEENGGTGVYAALSRLVFEKIGMIVAYPVENENSYSDSLGNVLPDAILMPAGSTVIELAGKVHADLAKKFIGAVDARTKRKVGKEHPLKNGDIIKIIAGK